MTHVFLIKTGEKKRLLLWAFLVIFFSFSVLLKAQSLTEVTSVNDCDESYSTELISMTEDGDCITFILDIKVAAGAAHALSHYTVGVPCGTISDIIVSENWAVENPTSDPTTGVEGFKIDEISGFGEEGQSGSFTVAYTVCSDDKECMEQLKDSIYVAYKAATCVYYESLYPDPKVSLDASVYHTDVSCFAGNNGAAGIEIINGTPPFLYSWSNGASTKEITGLKAGDYSVQISDSTGDSLSFSFSVLQPLAAISITEDITDASCGQNDGAIATGVTGGTQPYSYLWNNGDTTSVISQLYSGTYSLNVIDSAGCIKSESYQVEQNSDLTLSLTSNILECYQEGEGEVISSVQGGVEPYMYLWSNGDTTANLSNVNSGSYSLTVTDANGCSVSSSSYISIKSLSLTSSVVNPTCFGGDDGSVGVSNIYYGTEPYSYLWDTGDTTSVINNITSGRYRVTVTDANGCEASRNINVGDMPQVGFSYTISARDCSSNDSIEIELIGYGGMSGYTYYLDEEEISSIFKTDTAGTYTITVKDAYGCEYTETLTISEGSENLSAVANISQPACGGSSTGAVSLTVSGGTEPYSYLWSDGATTRDRDELAAGSYNVQVLDINGCYTSVEVEIEEANMVNAEIISSANQVTCETDSVVIYANYSGGSNYSWEIVSEDLSWYIEESSMDSLAFHAGSGSASFIYSVLDDEGCMDSDTLIVSCSSDNTADNGSGDETDDTNTDDGTNNSSGDGVDSDTDSGDDSSGSEDTYSFNGCFSTQLAEVVLIQDDCYNISIDVLTDGSCAHELSHLVVGLDNAYVEEASNTEGWKMELNITDPTTGVYGFKVDDISGFGQSGEDVFRITFRVCFTNGLPDYLPIAFKAANGYEIQTLYLRETEYNNGNMELNIFPNPFKDEVNMKLLSGKDTYVRIDIYDMSGNMVKRIFEGTILSGISYTVKYDGTGTNERILFYKVYTDDEVMEGKLLRVK